MILGKEPQTLSLEAAWGRDAAQHDISQTEKRKSQLGWSLGSTARQPLGLLGWPVSQLGAHGPIEGTPGLVG